MASAPADGPTGLAGTRPKVVASATTPLLSATTTPSKSAYTFTPPSSSRRPFSHPAAAQRSLSHSEGPIQSTPSNPGSSSTSHPSPNPFPKSEVASLDLLLSRWTHAVAQKMRSANARRLRTLKKRKRRQQGLEVVPIVESVFTPVFAPNREQREEEIFFTDKAKGAEMSGSFRPRTLDHGPPTSVTEFAKRVEAVRKAIDPPPSSSHQALLPKLNGSGSSGSYFCKAHVEVDEGAENERREEAAEGDGAGETRKPKVQIVGIFKPKDEEPYGDMNPKWTKWAHRVLLAPLIGGFGRSCLIPNLSYLSEAAASLLDRRLALYIVPRTEVVDMASPTFFYTWVVRKNAKRRMKKGKPAGWPMKAGSFQLFAQGFEDASSLLMHHPWPGRKVSDTLDPDAHRHPRRKQRFSLYRIFCGHRLASSSSPDEDDDDALKQQERKIRGIEVPRGVNGEGARTPEATAEEGRWCWTQELMDDFRIEMEKLVILDFLMRNTDRGLDNFMIKICNADCRSDSNAASSSASQKSSQKSRFHGYLDRPHTHVAAIDNSLAFPHDHPRGWRDYSFGWLYLPVSLIGQPFSRSTRDHFLPLLTSPIWWSETTLELRQLFATDPDFNAKMFEKQMGIIKGQAWNVVQSLKHQDEGPLELCRRQKAIVWDDPIELPDDKATGWLLDAVATPRKSTNGEDLLDDEDDDELPSRAGQKRPTFEPSASYGTRPMQVTRPAHLRHSITADSPASRYQLPRPLPVSRGLQGMQGDFSGARGFDVMQHMEAVQAREETFSRSLGMNGAASFGAARRQFWSPPAVTRPLSGSMTAGQREDEEEFPWGSLSEGDVRPPHSALTSADPTPVKPPLAKRESSAWRDRLAGAAWRKGPGAKPGHRRSETTNDMEYRSLLAHRSRDGEPDVDRLEALSEGGAEGDDVMTDGGGTAITDGKEAGRLVVRERLEFVHGKAVFAC